MLLSGEMRLTVIKNEHNRIVHNITLCGSNVSIVGIGVFLFSFFLVLQVFVAVRGLSLVVVSMGRLLFLAGVPASHCSGFSCCEAQARVVALGLQSSGSVDVHRLSFKAHGIFADQGSNLCPLCWQVDSYLLHHQGVWHLVFKSDLRTIMGHPCGSEVKASAANA